MYPYTFLAVFLPQALSINQLCFIIIMSCTVVQTHPLGNNDYCCEYCVSPGQKLYKDLEVRRADKYEQE